MGNNPFWVLIWMIGCAPYLVLDNTALPSRQQIYETEESAIEAAADVARQNPGREVFVLKTTHVVSGEIHVSELDTERGGVTQTVGEMRSGGSNG